MQYKTINIKEIQTIDEENFTIDFIFSTADTDRHGDVVDQTTFKFSNFLQNPVVLFSHDHNQPAVGRVEGMSFNDQGYLQGRIKFAAEQYDFARTLWSLYANGFMRAVSIGFMPEEVVSEGDGSKLVGNELFEVSLVNVPANARALAKQKGIDLSPLDETAKTLTKTEIEKLKNARKEARRAIKEIDDVIKKAEHKPEEDKSTPSPVEKSEKQEDEENGSTEPSDVSPTPLEDPKEEENPEESSQDEQGSEVSADNSDEKVDVLNNEETPESDRAENKERKKRLVNKRIRELLEAKKRLQD